MRFEILKTSAQWAEAFPLLKELRPSSVLVDIESRRERLLADGYELHGLYEESVKVVCVAGIGMHAHLIRSHDLWIHELVTQESERGQGYGLAMLRYLESYAREKGCNRLYLHTQLFREDAQRFYEQRAGYNKYALVYNVDL